MKLDKPHWPTVIHLAIIVGVGYLILRTLGRRKRRH